MSGCGHEEIGENCIFCGTEGQTYADIEAGQKAFDLKMRKAKAWDEIKKIISHMIYNAENEESAKVLGVIESEMKILMEVKP